MFGAPSPLAEAPLAVSNYIQPNLGHGLRIWWAFYWPTTLVAAILTIALNLGVRRLYENSNVPGGLLHWIVKIGPYFFTYAVALFMMYVILHKNFQHFRIGLLSNHGGEGAQPLKATFWRALRVWFTYSWRTLFYRLIAWVVVVLPLMWFLGLFNPRR